ncbi:deaminase [Pseudoalteromonas sp.]|uniref:deaminase n=1 Tax=Pseudoalteromonas sp. TaxID=53249 RepID=UPI0023571368|nr:deaminase [Pseudoalteromonas sp.]
MTNYEIFIALVAPRGINVDTIIDYFSISVKGYGYNVEKISLLDMTLNQELSDDFYPNRNKIDHEGTRLTDLREVIISEANKVRGLDDKLLEPHELFSSLVIDTVQRIRKKTSNNNTIYILDNLKHPKELTALKQVYKNALYTIGITDSLVGRINHKKKQFEAEESGLKEDAAVHKSVKYIVEDYLKDPSKKVVEVPTTDGIASVDVSNQVGEAYLLSDFFINLNSSEFEDNTDEKLKLSIERFVDLLFGAPNVTPTKQEHSMFLAYTSAIRSGDLSRQVGSAIVNKMHDVIAMGANEVPKAGGGQYWANDTYIPNTDENIEKLKSSIDQRDFVKGCDTNAIVKDKLTKELVSLLADANLVTDTKENRELVARTLQKSTLKDITEYGRVVHAEMSALMSAARNGTKVKNMHMFCTTYPCHNCAKHLVAAGIQTVHYIEPYPKSKAVASHEDSIFDPDSMNLSAVGEGETESLIDEIVNAYIENTLKNSQWTHEDNLKKLTFEPFTGVGPSRYVDLFSMNMGSGRPIKRKKGSQAITLNRSPKAIPRVPITSAHNLFYEQEFIQSLSVDFDIPLDVFKKNILNLFHQKFKLQDEKRQESIIKFWHDKHSYGYIVSETGEDFPFNKQNLEDSSYKPQTGDIVSFVPLKGDSVTFANKITKVIDKLIAEKTSSYDLVEKESLKLITSTIKFLNEDKNFGHIKNNEPKDYYFRFDQVLACSIDKLNIGAEVEFQATTSSCGKPQAKNVKVIG